MENSLLEHHTLPPFRSIRTSLIEPAIDTILKQNRLRIKKLLGQTPPFTWDNLIVPLEDLEDQLHQAWSPVRHLNAVKNSQTLRKIYANCEQKITEYATELKHNIDLYRAIRSIKTSKAFKKLNIEQKKVIHNECHDFKLAGVTLNKKDKHKFAELEKRHAKLTTRFESNLLDATDAWQHHITKRSQLSGLPEHIITSAKETAKRKKKKGWLFTLDFPTYHSVLTYADNQKLRKAIYTAYVTRASDQGPLSKKYDNSKIMDELLDIRHQMAQLVGFDNFAEYSLATKMAKTPTEVMQFLDNLSKRSKSTAKKEFQSLKKFARKEYDISSLGAWDIAYYAEKLRKQKYDISQETLRPYFPENHVLKGMFKLVDKLYAISVKEKTNKDTWHKDVRFFEIFNAQKKLIGSLYVDLYARPHKRGGAWMDECRIRRKLKNNKIQLPVAYLTCNFSKPIGGKPSLLTHDESLTLFHEFGHCLHHLLTKVDYPEISGINGVEWDAVELPSQFMENFCWQKPVLDMLTCHYQTHEKLPNDLFNKLIQSKNFHSGLQIIRQLEFSMFDFRIHNEYDPKKGAQIQKTLDQVRKNIGVIPTPSFNRFQHSFTHVFGGEYAAGYYSYKWAEVLSCDAFSKFEETKLLNKKIGLSFLHNILEKGGSRNALQLFIKFRGRKPKIDALLKNYGLIKNS